MEGYGTNVSDPGKTVNINEIKDFNIVCGLLKQFLRELKPEPLLTFRLYLPFVQVIGRYLDSLVASFICEIEKCWDPSDEDTAVKQLKVLIESLPEANQRLLNFLMQFFASIASKAPQNKMTPANLGMLYYESY